MGELDVNQAVFNTSDKARALWPSRTSANRLEPQCWPILQPRFQLEPGSRVFTIGSCFAREIERALADLGFEIPVFNFHRQHPELLAFEGINALNRYTPPSIFQELSWTQKIMDRDDVVNQDDVEPMLLEAGNGRVYDLTRVVAAEYGITREQALNQRRSLYTLYRQAFNCEAVVITLGLIECWKDIHTGLYVEYNRGILRNKNRFRFKRIDYVEALDYVERAIDIINRDHHAKILLTTSPVPLTRTFTRDDVIVANTYSKSVLRAVAGAVAESRPNVDYFPSFESVMLSKDRQVWMDDLIHIEPSFIGSIMVRVTDSYAPDVARKSPIMEMMYRVINLTNACNWSQAQAELSQMALNNLPDEPAAFFVCAAELAARCGDIDMVKAMTARAPGVHADLQLRCGNALKAVGLNDLASLRLALALKLGTKTARGLYQWINILYHSGRREDLIWVLEEAEKIIDLDASTSWSLACAYRNAGRQEDCERLLRAAIAVDPLHEDAILTLAHRLIDGGRADEGLKFLRPLELSGSTSVYLHPLVSEHLRCGRPLQAKALIERLVRATPDNAGLQHLLLECEVACANRSSAVDKFINGHLEK
jgi:tetratricopeptide (TPR) repeat protein